MFTVTDKPDQEIKTTLFKEYRILNKDTDYQNLVSMLNVLSRATATMNTPLMFHFVMRLILIYLKQKDLFKNSKNVLSVKLS